jgi:hypothetical protein
LDILDRQKVLMLQGPANELIMVDGVIKKDKNLVEILSDSINCVSQRAQC